MSREMLVKNENQIGAALVLGGGIGGMQAALDLAESGIKVYLVDNKPCVGGVMAQLDKTFPTNDCAMCTMAPRLVEIGRHKDIDIITLAQIEGITGAAGNFTVSLTKKPRFVDEAKCTGCGICAAICPVRNEIYLYPKETVGINLEPAEISKIEDIIAKYKETEGILLPILHDINTSYGYLPRPVLEYISIKIDTPLSLIYRIATFYNFFRLMPKVKYMIHVCTGTACYIKGAREILEAFERELGIKEGEVTPDLSFGMGNISCFGCCGQAPVVVINDDIYGHFKVKQVTKLLKSYKAKLLQQLEVPYGKN